VRRARLLNAAGFLVFLFDFQAHGESTGACITFGHLEVEDAGSSVAFVRARLPNERIGAIGTSLGGAAALPGPHPLPVNAPVLRHSRTVKATGCKSSASFSDNARDRNTRLLGRHGGYIVRARA
jgi:alpha/beta superfamily hydrolase